MNYLDRIRQIQRNFVTGFLDRESSLTLFEDLLHEYGLLPVEEQLDRTLTNENFLALLRLAQEHRGARSSRDSEISKDLPIGPDGNVELPPDSTSIQKTYAKDLDRIGDLMGLNRDRYRIADSIIQNCPLCKAKCAGLYNRMQSLDNQIIPVDPPRCQKCMMKWVEEKFGLGVHSKVAEASPSASVDVSLVKPLDDAETDFFKMYEKQMEEKL